MTVCITGWGSKIAEEFRRLTDEECIRGDWQGPEFPLDCRRYLFCHGMLMPKRAEDQTECEREQSWIANYISTAGRCDGIIASNPKARMCVIGSESGYRGSFDGTYAEAKAAMHLYIEERRCKPHQQLVGISPGIIGDCGMTTRREDVLNVERRRKEHPMQRFATAREVAKLAHFLLYDGPYISGTIVRMHGGQK